MTKQEERDAAKAKAMSDIHTPSLWGDAFSAGFDKAWNAAVKATEKRWIPVEERLPEVDGDYIFQFRDSDRLKVQHFDPNHHGRPMRELEEEWWIREYVAWMPLPDPYIKQLREG